MNKKKSLVFSKKVYAFLIPALVLFLTFWIVPIIQLFYYSITNFNGTNYNYSFVGLKNYIRVFQDGSLINACQNTIIYTALIVVFSNLLGLGIAMLLNTEIRAKGIFRTCAYMPALFSAIVVGFIWSYVYMPGNGMLATLLSFCGIDGNKVNVLAGFQSSLYGIAVVDIWKNFGTTMIIYLAGLQTVDTSLLEAGKIDGCTEWQLFRLVKLPLISATVTINVILNVIAGLKAFDYSFIMTNGGPGKATETLMFVIYQMAFVEQKMGRASAFSVVSFILIITVTVLMLIYMNKKEVEL
ncbi:MAG: sugar ABC transporter permease [bacterium]|nr:sugar ABC transporter permease [bacterium]